MRRFDRLPKVSEGVYERVQSEREGMDGWDEAVIVNTIEGGWSVLREQNPLLVKAFGDVLKGMKKQKERLGMMLELYFVLRVINDALAERG